MPFDLACPDWWDRLQAGKLPVPELPIEDFDGSAAAAAVETFGMFRVPDAVGQPALRDAGAAWFPEIIRRLWGVLDETRARYFREAFIMVPKKNGKTTYTAALALTALLLNEIPNAEIMVVGPTKDAADTLFQQACGMVRADEPSEEYDGESYLSVRFQIVEGEQRIKDRHTGASLVVRSLSAKVVTGKILIMCIFDEVHEMGSSVEAEKVLRQARGGMVTRENTLMLFITTQSDGPPRGVFARELREARGIRDGNVTGARTLVCLYELPEAVQNSDTRDWRNPDLWRPLWPNYGKTLFLDRMKEEHAREVRAGIGQELSWASQHLNLQLGVSTFAEQWTGGKLWLDAAVPLSLDELLDRSEVVTAGIDGGGLDDLLALALIGRDRDTKAWLGWGRAWAQSEVLGAASAASDAAKARRPGIQTELEEFERDGDLFRAHGATDDLEALADILAEVAERGLFPEKYGIGLDPFSVSTLVDVLAAQELKDPLITAVPQGVKLSGAIWGMERRLKSKTFRPRRCGLLTWAAGNARSEQRGNAIYISKAVAGRAKIDPLTAMFNAFQLMTMSPTAAPRGVAVSPWENPGFSILGQIEGA